MIRLYNPDRIERGPRKLAPGERGPLEQVAEGLGLDISQAAEAIVLYARGQTAMTPKPKPKRPG